ncbi:MAG: hypothetical protein JWP12_3617 [Bacteroidetes bacterium]|nr:hypothetical protein [Bacteroidota bacterium]
MQYEFTQHAIERFAVQMIFSSMVLIFRNEITNAFGFVVVIEYNVLPC